MAFYLYIRKIRPKETVVKIGVTKKLASRDSTYKTGEYTAGKFIAVFKINGIDLDYFDDILKQDILPYHTQNTGGTEFYNDTIDIQQICTDRIESNSKLYGYTYKRLTSDEIINLLRIIINKFNKYSHKKYTIRDVFNRWKQLSRAHDLPPPEGGGIGEDRPLTIQWDERSYQQNIIELGTNNLRETHRYYLELATGGGKTYIVYKLLDIINPDTIIIFSPRKKINGQNGNINYLSILGEKYHTFNYSTDTNLEDWLSKHKEDKKIIIACTQSQEKIYHSIVDNNLSNISIWFDEAHWSIESWIDCVDSRSKQFFIQKTDRIKKRIFTSASPDKEKVKAHPNVFGKLCCPITVKELIALKWLCPINPRILEYDNESLNLSDWVIEEFTKTDSHFGFSFHSRDNNAFHLFHQHYLTYKAGNTTIKPYLLIDNGGLSDVNKKRLENIELDYDFSNDTTFEINDKSIGYVCKKYDMGYDFAKLDYLVFSDPKMSRQDIIQCIGRGTRPDGLGENGQNLHKILNIMLPVYIGEDEGSYKNIIEVLRYLVLNLDVDILEDFIRKPSPVLPSDKKGKGVEYGGDKNKSVLLDLIYQRNILERPTAKILYRFCRKYEIMTEEAYNRFKRLNPSIPLKDNIYEYNGFKWQNVMDPDGEIYYGQESDIVKAEDQIVSQIDDEEEEEFYAEREENGWIVLNRYDSKIPPMKIGQLEHYY
jgi:superfamily II DNA or RNA helicase